MSLEKDIKIGDDKRPISKIVSQEKLYNIANGEVLTDEFGNEILTEVETYVLSGVTMEKSTSVVFNTKSQSSTNFNKISIASTTATYSSGNTNNVGIATTNPSITVGDFISGTSIPDGTRVSRVGIGSIFISNNTINTTSLSELVLIERKNFFKTKSRPTIKIAEQFRESSEVSTTLLGVNRAETQLSLFSNVSSYGLDPDEFEFYAVNSGISLGSWEERRNAVYGYRYRAKQTEETQESGIRLTAFPTPYSFPFGPKFEKLGLYNSTLFQQYLNFIQLGNQLYDYFNTGTGSTQGYPSSWKENFLPKGFAEPVGGDVKYNIDIESAFARIDTWADTWRNIKDGTLTDPDNQSFNFAKVNQVTGTSQYGSDTTRPGYSDSNSRFAYLQSRRVFRYQPGRISGFTFGLRSSTEAVTGITLEWGISNPTDQYVFKIDAGQFSIVRRSTVPLETEVLTRNGLTSADQKYISSGNPLDSQTYYTITIPRDKFNGDPLNSNGPSGYLIQPEKVTMYKIEFGWYGAIGARFYVYIPTGNGDARWVVAHTLVIENSLTAPCLRDSYFRFKYSLNIANTGDVRTPQYLYKYGASYYIDGGDEGTSEIYSVSSGITSTFTTTGKTLLGIAPKQSILNRDGIPIENKKLIIPTNLNISTDSLTEVKTVSCSACPGFGHVYTPGIGTTESGRNVNITFTSGDTISADSGSYFYESDIGAKLIAPSIYNAYIKEVSDQVGSGISFQTAKIEGFTGVNNLTLGTRDLSGTEILDRVAGIVTTIDTSGDVSYPYPVRLSNYNAVAAAEFKFTGSKIEIQFVNPGNGDDYAHFADFLIGVTDKTPDVSLPDTLNGFVIGAATTTVLPNSDILFGKHTHSYARFDENGVEQGEGWGLSQPPLRMGIDYRIPGLANPAGGTCSKVTITVDNPIEVVNAQEYSVNPETGDNDGSYFIQIPGTFPSLTYTGGQVALLNPASGTPNTPVLTYVTYSEEPVGPYVSSGNLFSYIKISGPTGLTNFTLLFRPVRLTGTGNVNASKLYNYNPFPLYLVAKLQDNSQINNITVKETVGDFQRTISPKWYVNDKASVQLYGGKTDNAGTPPTNFLEIDRLSSALIDTQNNSQLRPSQTRDVLYIGANTTKSINMSKVFGQDRRVITPDNNNVEATFIVAKKIDGAPGDTGTIQSSLNFKEQ
jgi:hypothetical protein